ncbi:MAG: hypothetical protein J0L64_06440 [Acidobacteria bacterium]|nr:hypothetical protein [Acidobacteriota bacterium]
MALSPDPHAAGLASKFATQALTLPLMSHEEEHVGVLLEKAPRGVIFPSNDANVQNLARHAEILAEAGFHFYAPSSAALDGLINKDSLCATCAECGVRTPRSTLVRTEDDLAHAAERFAYPLLLKPTNLAGGVYRLVPERSKLREQYQELRSLLLTAPYRHRKAGIMVQEWIPQESAELWNITGCVADGEITCAAMGRRLRTERRRDGTTGSALLHGVSAYDEEIYGLTQKLLRHVRYRGLVECEWSKSIADGGGTVLYDVNPRPSGNIRWALGSGAPLVEHYYRLALGLEPSRGPVMQEGIEYFKVIWAQTDIGGALENPAYSPLDVVRVGLQNVRAMLPFSRAVVDVWDTRDAGPTWSIVRQQSGRLLRGALRKLRPHRRWDPAQAGRA